MRATSWIYAICCTAGVGIGGCVAPQRPSTSFLPELDNRANEQRVMVDRQVRAVHSFNEAMQPEGAVPEAEGAELIPPPPPAGSRVAPQAPAAEPIVNDGLRPIGRLTVGIAPPRAVGAAENQMGLPDDLALERFGEEPPLLVQSEPFAPWNAYGQLVLSADFCHRPLYFEDINLERYGRSHGIAQPFISAARFYAAVPALPYKLVAEPPTVCMQDNSRWPAGGYAPHHRNLPPFDAKAGLVEAATIIGLILLIP